MGSVIVDIMAGSTLAAEHKKLHPFFTTPKALQPDSPQSSSSTTATIPTIPADSVKAQDKMGELDESDVTPAKRKRRKAAEEGEEDWEDTKKPKRGRPKKIVQQGPSIMKHFSKTNEDFKEPGLLKSSPTLEQDPEKAAATSSQAQPQASAAPHEVALHDDDRFGQNGNDDNKRAPPKKMLQFNPKTGTIGSPPKPKEPKPSKKQINPEETTKDTITPPRKGKRRSNRIATINYGLDDASRIRIGAKIDAILNDTTTSSRKRKTRLRNTPQVQKKAHNTGAEASEETATKDTHPFFTGKAKKPAADPAPALKSEAVKMKPAPAPTRPRIFSSTPCSPRKPRPTMPSTQLPQFGVRSLSLKTPGARHPAWPSKDMAHVRGSNDAISLSHPLGKVMAARKSKGNTIQITAVESLLNHFATGLDIPEVLKSIKNADTENFRPPPVELRLPKKHFESGVRLEKRVLRELKKANHPALAQLRNLLVNSLSAFDRYTCESACWAQKYTPKSAVEVLQYGKEAFLLRDWLEAMKVLSVDTGEVKVKAAKPPKKKRKKNKDDFIVDSDEEADNMDEVSDPEEDWSPDRRGFKKTVIRTGDNAAKDSKKPGRFTNTVLISGPHGCGKTSAVYAVAKELDFEVFEINSGSRRSGKDILEKIGDMTRNHLVQHDQTDSSAAAIDEEEVAEDIKSGKQATMNSFFKPKAAQQPPKPKPIKDKPAPVKTESKKLLPKSQKQSLILLDEVDILYEEDKQFWSTVITLIAQSKRPFIMTCNDENLVPLQALSLHGIFRFSTPPADLAVDRLLMIAACEGHALRRDAIAALYEARQQDLRACLMDLNCWCQVAVGASRGGIDWLLPRWPKGCDIDAHGDVVRVISQDTYVEGMGWLGHDVVSQDPEHGNTEQELLQEVHDFWQMDLANWHDSLDLPSWAGTLDDTEDQLSLLKSYEEFTDAMSLADLSAMSFATSLEEPIDCTLPEMTQKTREDYIFGRQLLDAPVRLTYDPLATPLPIALKCLARKNLQASSSREPSQLNALDEANVISKIRHFASASFDHSVALSRDDFSMAFDVLAISEKEASATSTYLDPSVFDGTLHNITVDVAPYVRNIVAFEKELQKQRQKLSGLLSQGGTKRGRKTRAAHAALEGGSRSTVRREKWFDAELNHVLVMNTAGEGWSNVVDEDHSSVYSSASPVDSAARKARARRIVMDGCNDGDDGGSGSMDVE